MNALKLHFKSESKGKDFYVQFTYPIGVKVVPFQLGATETVKIARLAILLDLLDHFVVAERKITVKPTSQVFVENIKNVTGAREWLHDRKETKFDLCLSVIKDKVFPAVLEVVQEYDIQEQQQDDLIKIMGTIKGTIENQ